MSHGGPLPFQTLGELCAVGAERFGDRPAVQHRGAALSYAALAEGAAGLARRLRRDGIEPGDCILLALENSLEYVISLFGALAAGAVVVPVNPDTTGEAIGYIAADCAAQGIITRARIDDEGFIYVVSRKSDFIKSASYRISPGEVEEVIAEVPGVEDVAVGGTEDELLGEAIVACVSCAPEAFDGEKIRSHCLERLSMHKVPKYVVHEPQIPKTASGKKRYAELRGRYKTLASEAPRS